MPDSTRNQLPAGIEKRPNYFDGRYLNVEDFNGEQQYHIDRQRRPLRYLHVSGILDGLQVAVGGTPFTVTVAPGSAIDAQGRQILLQSAVLLRFLPPLQQADSRLTKSAQDTARFELKLDALKPTTKAVTYYLSLAYDEEQIERQTEAGSEQFRRWHERPVLQVASELAQDDLPLAQLTASISGIEVNTSVCRYSGVNFPNDSGSELTMRSQGNQVQLQGNLSITGQVGIGTDDPKSQLAVSGGAAIGTTYASTHPAPTNGLIVAGRLGVGTPSPQHALSIQGGALAFHDPTTAQPFVPVGIDYDKTLDALRFRADFNGSGLHADHLTIKRVTGNVGIGTTDPAAKLEISGTAGTVLRVGQPSATANSTAVVELPGIVRLKRWSSSQYAHLEATDGQWNNSIGLIIRTQNAVTNPNATATPTVKDALTIKPDGTLGSFSVSGSVNVSGAVNFGATQRQMLDLWESHYGIGVQNSTQYFRTGENFAWYKGGTHNNAELNPGGGVAQMVIKDGKVGIGTSTPDAAMLLDVAGGLKAKSYKTTLYNAGGIRSSAVAIGEGKGDNFYRFPDLEKHLFLTEAVCVLVYYHISMDAMVSYMVTRLMAGTTGKVQEVGRAISGGYNLQPPGGHWDNSNFWIGELGPGNCDIWVEYRTPTVGNVNNPAGTGWHDRSLQVLVLGSI